MHVCTKTAIITIIINGFHLVNNSMIERKRYGKIIEKWDILREERERERERGERYYTKMTVTFQSKASKYWSMLLTFLSFRNFNLRH